MPVAACLLDAVLDYKCPIEALVWILGVFPQVALLSPFIQREVLRAGRGVSQSEPVVLPKQVLQPSAWCHTIRLPNLSMWSSLPMWSPLPMVNLLSLRQSIGDSRGADAAAGVLPLPPAEGLLGQGAQKIR